MNEGTGVPHRRCAVAAWLLTASMVYTAKKYTPDRVIGFSPIPSMSMVSYAGGSRLLQLFGTPVLSFYDMCADFPPASPETWAKGRRGRKRRQARLGDIRLLPKELSELSPPHFPEPFRDLVASPLAQDTPDEIGAAGN